MLAQIDQCNVFTCESIDNWSQDSGGPDHFFQDIGLGRQREAVVKHLLEELVHCNNIVLNNTLCALSKVILLGKKTTTTATDVNNEARKSCSAPVKLTEILNFLSHLNRVCHSVQELDDE